MPPEFFAVRAVFYQQNGYMLEWKQRSKQKQYNLLRLIAEECEDRSMKKEENT